MATCKECSHVEVCKAIVTIINEATELQIDDDTETTIDADLTCEYFADRSRFVELPCKLGDTLFVPTRNLVSEYKIVSFHVCGEGIWYRTNVIKGILTRLISDNVEIIGETVFLTREEAERALKLKECET